MVVDSYICPKNDPSEVQVLGTGRSEPASHKSRGAIEPLQRPTIILINIDVAERVEEGFEDTGGSKRDEKE